MSIVTKESNPELYNALFEDATIEDAKKVMQNMFNDIKPEQFEELKKQALENVKKNNMSAKEMFDKLDYHIKEEYDYKIVYIRGTMPRLNHNNKALPKKITFWSELNSIDFEYGRTGSYLYLELLQAINKQIEELGWLDEK